MAIKHRMTRTATRITIEALKAYLPKLAPEGQKIVQELIDSMTVDLNHSYVNRQQPVRWAYDTPEYKADIDAERGNPVEHSEQD